MNIEPKDYQQYIQNISQSRLSIYDIIQPFDPNLWIPTEVLEEILDSALIGLNLDGLPNRTRSKVLKSRVCEALGYPVPDSFTKTQPRFPGQNFDTYVQKSNNLQIWNETISPTRRYVIIHVSNIGVVDRVKVVNGESLAKLDKTGTLTQKYQAGVVIGVMASELLASEDTERIKPLINKYPPLTFNDSPASYPVLSYLMPIYEIYSRLKVLVNKSFVNLGEDQERNRGAELHRLVCKNLGYTTYHDHGQFPDVRHQLLEVKLQTSPTIDLGLVSPDSREILEIPSLGGTPIRHCDVRYAVFCAKIQGGSVYLTNFYLTTGEKFFERFRKFQGKVINKKLQIPLPATFFNR